MTDMPPALRIALLIGVLLLAWPCIVVHALIAWGRLILLAYRNRSPEEILHIALTMRPRKDMI